MSTFVPWFMFVLLIVVSAKMSDGFIVPCYPIKANSPPANGIPGRFDAREKWGNECPSIGAVRNQGTCNSCWAFSAAQSMTDRLCIKTNGSEQINFSPQNLLGCCQDCVVDPTDMCSNGYAKKAFDYWINNGVVSEACVPYSDFTLNWDGNPATPYCPTKCNDSENYEESKQYGSSVGCIWNNIEATQIEIMTNGPVVAYMVAYPDFQDFRSNGIYYGNPESGNAAGHYIRIIGWDSYNDEPVWIAINTFGTDWGNPDDPGSVKLPRGDNRLEVGTVIIAGSPKTSK